MQSSLVHELPDGITFGLTPERYIRNGIIAQFYFHAMAAYAILRFDKTDLRKSNYVMQMFQYIRPKP